MPSTPTTKSQVHAYQFVVRRLESALARKDAVMLHEPTRTHSRAMIVGVILGVLGLAGFAIFGFFKPADRWQDNQIVVSKGSGAMYTVLKEPDRLVPVPNLASARLLLSHQKQGGGAGKADPAMIEESSLTEAPRTPLAGIPGGPTLLPGTDQRVPAEWALCDDATLNERLPRPEQRPELESTAMIGVGQRGTQLGDEEALLVTSDGGGAYLVYDGVRARVDLSSEAVTNVFKLSDITPRQVSNSLLNAIPETQPLRPPEVPQTGKPSQFQLSGEKTGGVVRVERAGTGEEYYLVHPDGKQRVPQAVADLVHFSVTDASSRFTDVRPEQINNVPDTANPIDLSHYPRTIPEIVGFDDATVTCLNWTVAEDQQRSVITTAGALPTPGEATPVQLSQADGTGPKLDNVLLPPGKAAVVRSVVPGQNLSTGSIWLISDQGVRFAVPSEEVAKILGLGTPFDPAPESILRLLPEGPTMDPEAAVNTFDGQNVTEDGQQRASGGQG